MTVYADVLFAINFSMDFISLFITQLLLNRKIYKKRILISSAIGGVYGVFELLTNMNTFLGIAVNIAVAFLMCFICYYEGSIRRFISMYVIYWGISMALAGFMSLLYSFMNKILSEYILDYSYGKVYNGARFFIIASLSVITAIIFGRAFSKEKNIRYTDIKVELNGKEYCIKVLCDTGNTLREPLSGKGVILVSKECELGSEIEKIPDIYKRYIPYSATNSSGLLKGIAPKVLLVDGKNTDAIIAPTENRSFSGYEGCIPYSLV